MKRPDSSRSKRQRGHERAPAIAALGRLSREREHDEDAVKEVFLPGRGKFIFERALRDVVTALWADGKRIETKLDDALEAAARHLGTDFAILSEPKVGECEIVAAYVAAGQRRLRPRLAKGARYPVRNSLCMTTLMMEDAWTLEDPEGEARVAEIGPCRTFIACSVVVSDHYRGSLSFFSLQERDSPFSESEKLFVQLLAREISREIESNRSFQALKLLESRAQHSQKLETLGMVAGGVAHEFCNLLMGILGNSRLALNELNERSPARQTVGRIERIAEHAAGLSKQLLAYSGKSSFSVEVLNLSSIVEEMVQLLQSAISKKHVVKCNFPSDLPIIDGDASLISQVVMNLVTNASDAIGDQPGVITLSTGLLSVDRDLLDTAYLGEDAKPGVYTYVRVSDTGCGMDAGTQSQIFDPFFTTKINGRGLGLPVTLGIVRSHRGMVRIQSSPGSGTTVTVLFPCSANQGAAGAHAGGVQPQRTLAKVLLVDDEDEVRGVVAELLRQIGYEVWTAVNGETGLAVFKERAETLDLAIVDLTMPDMDGVTVLRRMQEINPKVPVVLSSGYSPPEVTGSRPLPGCAGFLHKPYRLQELRAMIEPILNPEPAGGV